MGGDQWHGHQGSRLQVRFSHACSYVPTWRGAASGTDLFLYECSALNVKCPLADVPRPSLDRMRRPHGMDFIRRGEDECLHGRFLVSLAARRGKKRAIIAMAHASMVRVFHKLSHKEPYRELGTHYFDEQRQPCTIDRLTRRIEYLGYRVHLEPVVAPAA